MIEPSLLFVTLAYVGLVVSYGASQDRYARQYLARRPRPASNEWPSVDIVLPCYNEDPDVLAKSCDSLDRLDYPGRLRFFLVDDGSSNRETLEPVYRRYQRRRHWTVIMKRPRLGKREVQAAAIRRGVGELVVTIDSDTVLQPDALRRLVAAFSEDDVGAVTGDVRALNSNHNWLTRLLDERYRLLFEQERAAQSNVGAVLCCAGPFSAYRREAVKAVLRSYREQTFLGLPCITGDDIHLTNLVLAEGYRSVYEPSAKAQTIVPTTLRHYVRQQARWNRSFYRELVPTLRAIENRSPYLRLDVTARLVLPMLFTLGIVLVWMQAADGRALGGLLSLGIMGIAGGGLLTRKTARPRPNLAFIVWYGLIYALLLIPVRFWALATLRSNGWGTRRMPRGSARRSTRKPTSPVPKATTTSAAQAIA